MSEKEIVVKNLIKRTPPNKNNIKRAREMNSSSSDCEGSVSDNYMLKKEITHLKVCVLDVTGKFNLLFEKFELLSNELLEVKKINVNMLNEIKMISGKVVASGPPIDSTNYNVPQINDNLPLNVSYSNVVKSSVSNLVVLKPKNTEQKKAETVKAMNEKLNPTGIDINRIRGTAKGGGVIIECSSKEDVIKLKNIATDQLGDSYSVETPNGRKPMILISNVSNKMDDDKFIETIRSNNDDLFFAESAIKILGWTHVKRFDNYCVKLQLDAKSFANVIKCNKIRIGWDLCQVKETFNIIRCFKCNDFNHMAANCSVKSFVCPKCSGNHCIADCTSNVFDCINCKVAATALQIYIDSNHPTWSDSCRVYNEKVAVERRRINYNYET